MPVLADGFAFEAINPGSVASPDPGYVEALDACTGAPAWQAPLVSPLGSAVTSLAAGDGYLVVSGWSGLEAFKGSGMPPEPPPICNPAQLPAAATPPTITGAAQLGQLLSVSGATWSRSPLTFSYQWERCNAAGVDCAAIAARTRRPTQSHLAMSVTQSVPPKPRLIPTARARRSPHPRPPLFCGHHHRHTRAPRPQASGPDIVAGPTHREVARALQRVEERWPRSSNRRASPRRQFDLLLRLSVRRYPPSPMGRFRAPPAAARLRRDTQTEGAWGHPDPYQGHAPWPSSLSNPQTGVFDGHLDVRPSGPRADECLQDDHPD